MISPTVILISTQKVFQRQPTQNRRYLVRIGGCTNSEACVEKSDPVSVLTMHAIMVKLVFCQLSMLDLKHPTTPEHRTQLLDHFIYKISIDKSVLSAMHALYRLLLWGYFIIFVAIDMPYIIPLQPVT
ncbi:MAG: hypothetical protein HNEKOMLI_00358 [Sodalis sp. Psp]|nr:hypothetical protein [Sodalis sp. Psp]MCR3756844.1 hypothetical protein [Sodalis sp. Ppy]